MILKKLFSRNKANRSLYNQIIFVALAFFTMSLLSYLFMSSIVRDNLVRNANNTLNLAEDRIKLAQQYFTSTLNTFTVEVKRMILQEKSDPVILEQYLDELTDYVSYNGTGLSGIINFYGYFETLPGGPVLLSNRALTADKDYNPEELDWYRQAITTDEIIETVPRLSSANEMIITYARRIFDDDGHHLGVVCIDVQINNLGNEVVNLALNQGGYGMLLNQELLTMFHPNVAYIGKALTPELPYSIFKDDLLSGNDVYEQPLLSYKNERAIAFFRHLSNGWVLGLVTPESRYYSTLNRMSVVLPLLGTTLTLILAIILIRLDFARRKSDDENKKKSMFLANMSHEIRTPINAIVGMTTIGRNSDTIERKDYCFTKIDVASKHLLGVVNDILDMSKIEADKVELSITPFYFEKMLWQAVNINNFRVDEKRQKLNVNLDHAIPKVLCGDDQRIVQVITNLLGNAVKFTPDEGSITLDTNFLGEENGMCIIKIAITDNGIGITPDQQARLFQIFQQAESSTTRKYGGTGLGLAISRRIVELMGGKIWVESEYGKGSSFIFTIKLARGEAVPTVDTNEPDAEIEAARMVNAGDPLDKMPADINGLFAGRNVILAEDIEINQEIVISLLEPTRLHIECAENGLEAVRIFRQDPGKYDLILMDVQMPAMDGYEATRQIRAINLPQAEAIPIIAMTANVFKEDIDKCLKAGMNSHLGKPLDLNELVKTLLRYLPETARK